MWRFPGTNGYTLIELMVTVAIIGILAAIAIPNYLGFSARSKQSEGRMLLGAIATAEQAYLADQESYGTLSNAGFTPTATPKYYTNIMNSLTYSATSFSATAGANIDGDATRDLWILTSASLKPLNSVNDVIQ